MILTARRRGALGIAAALAFGAAHVGSPDTFFEGAAGPYPVRVTVRSPVVVPGLADIVVRITAAPERVHAVTVLPLRGGTPTAALPPADTAVRVTGSADLYTAQLWLMEGGSYSVQVSVAGDAGAGVALVPVVAVASGRRGFTTPLALALSALCLLLVVGALTIVGAAAREAVLPPGEEPDAGRRRRSWIARAVAVAVLGLALWGGKLWWDAEDGLFQRRLFRPPSVTTTADGGTLTFAISDSAWLQRRWTPLVPDHGKLIHLFLIGQRHGGFAHLHPVARDSSTFDSALPPLPADDYAVFADVVHESGFTQTLTDTVSLGDAPTARWARSDADDGYSTQPADGGGQAVTLEDGSRMTWAGPSALVANQETDLAFTVADPAGAAARLEPYLNMAGHAVIARDDGRVFIHLHPAGTVAMAAQLIFQLREPGDTVRGRLGQRVTEYQRSTPHDQHDAVSRVSFPYAFPSAGTYNVWVQVKRAGRILTGRFLVHVTEQAEA